MASLSIEEDVPSPLKHRQPRGPISTAAWDSTAAVSFAHREACRDIHSGASVGGERIGTCLTRRRLGGWHARVSASPVSPRSSRQLRPFWYGL